MSDKQKVHINKHPRLFLEDEIVQKVCHIGEMRNTCRYLAAGQNGFACIKLMPKNKELIDKIIDQMIAKADHCEGIEMLEGHMVARN